MPRQTQERRQFTRDDPEVRALTEQMRTELGVTEQERTKLRPPSEAQVRRVTELLRGV